LLWPGNVKNSHISDGTAGIHDTIADIGTNSNRGSITAGINQMGEYILKLLGVTVFVEGNLIDLGVTQLQVVWDTVSWFIIGFKRNIGYPPTLILTGSTLRFMHCAGIIPMTFSFVP
jgi:hypothetical protein